MNAVTYLANKRVNIDLMLYVDPKNILYIGVRIRPWSQVATKPLMVLSQGLTLADAIDKAARDYHLDRWQALDWRRRPWDSAVEEYDFDGPDEVLEFLAVQPNEANELLQFPESPENPPKRPLSRKMGGKST
jgi:hypothetical protein